MFLHFDFTPVEVVKYRQNKIVLEISEISYEKNYIRN
jgi:hypothetical protein